PDNYRGGSNQVAPTKKTSNFEVFFFAVCGTIYLLSIYLTSGSNPVAPNIATHRGWRIFNPKYLFVCLVY
ncbi:MAG: hypothetical protein WAU21_12825, partial [Chitinophagales bacterium]